MAFIGVLFISIFIFLMKICIILMLVFFVLAIVLKIIGSKKVNKKIKIAGNLLLVPGIMLSIPIIAMIILFAFSKAFTAVTLPDGEKIYVRTQYLTTMDFCAKHPNKISIYVLEKLLDKNNSLVFYHDINQESILEDGLEIGNADIVRIALDHGAIFDDPQRYDHVYYVNSMDDYLENCSGRSITGDDIEIVRMMFENNVSTELTRRPDLYSNAFGKAIWVVLYNDETVTDTEIEFIQIFINNGLSSDTELLLMEETPIHSYWGSEYPADVVKDSNYNQLMDIIGK